MKIAILSLVIACLVAALSVFQFERYQSFMINTDNTIAALNMQMQSKFQEYNLKLEDFRKLAMTLPKQAPIAMSDNKRNQVSFTLFEVENMMQIAKERLHMAQDVQMASQLLKTADERLQALNDPALAPIREALAQDRIALNAVTIPDLNGLWAAIGALLSQVDSIPGRGLRDMTNDRPQHCAVVNNQDSHSWKEALLLSLQSLKELVKVQRHSKPIEPILSLNEQVLAKEHLRLFLEQMRWAVLHSNETVYQDSLRNAEQWLDNYFESSDEQTQKLKAALKALEKIDVHPALPDISHTLQLLQASRQ